MDVHPCPPSPPILAWHSIGGSCGVGLALLPTGPFPGALLPVLPRAFGCRGKDQEVQPACWVSAFLLGWAVFAARFPESLGDAGNLPALASGSPFSFLPPSCPAYYCPLSLLLLLLPSEDLEAGELLQGGPTPALPCLWELQFQVAPWPGFSVML